ARRSSAVWAFLYSASASRYCGVRLAAMARRSPKVTRPGTGRRWSADAGEDNITPTPGRSGPGPPGGSQAGMKQRLPRPRPEQWFLLGLNVAAVAVFCYVFATRKNYEFLLYVGVIIAAGVLIVLSHERVRYPRVVLWGLTLWGLMHMAGGGIPVGSGTLYGV